MNRKLLSCFVLTFLLAVGIGNVKAQKIGHIDMAELLSTMPEYTKAQTELQNSFESKRAILATMLKGVRGKDSLFQVKVNKLVQTKGDQITDAEKTSLQGEKLGIDNDYKAVDEKSKELDKLFTDEQNKKLNPLQEKAIKAVKAVADANGFDYVLNVGAGVLIVKKGTDLITLTKKELGI